MVKKSDEQAAITSTRVIKQEIPINPNPSKVGRIDKPSYVTLDVSTDAAPDQSGDDSDDDDDDDDDKTSDTEEDVLMIPDFPGDEPIGAEYWQIQKLVKYIKGGNVSSTITALGLLDDHDLESEFIQMSIRDLNTLEVLVNILETDPYDIRCKKAALKILSRISINPVIQYDLTNLGIIPILVDLIVDPARDLQHYAGIVIANVANLKKSRKIVRNCGGIPLLIDRLDIPEEILLTPYNLLNVDWREELVVTRSAAQALFSLSHSKKNKAEMQKYGIVKLLPKLLHSVHEAILVHTMGMVQNYGTLPVFQLAILTMDLIEEIISLLSRDNIELKTLCSLAIFKHSEHPVIRELVKKHNGLDPLVLLMKKKDMWEHKDLLSAVTGAQWKCAKLIDNVYRLEQLDVIPTYIQLLDDEDETVVVHIAGALAECAKVNSIREKIKKSGGIKPLVELLNLTNQALLENTSQVLGECAWNLDCMEEMEQNDAVRLIWSLLKNSSTKVQASAAWALVPCIQNATDSGEMVRSFVGGIELIVKLLQSDDNEVVGCICAALAKVAMDRENLAVVTDLGVVPLLAKLIKTEDDFVREHLASAIANCCSWSTNCFEFGRLGVISPLVNFLKSESKGVQRGAIFAMCNLSTDPFNCISLHESGVVPYLLEAISSSDRAVQNAAAGCLCNIRKLAHQADKVKYRAEDICEQ